MFKILKDYKGNDHHRSTGRTKGVISDGEAGRDSQKQGALST